MVYRPFTADEIQRCYQDFYDGPGQHMTHERRRRDERKKECDTRFRVEVKKMLAPGEFLEGDGIRGRVARKVTTYIYPEDDFKDQPNGTGGSLDICYRYNEDENRVLQEFAEQGWELVSVAASPESQGNWSRSFYFKRELELIPWTFV